MAKSTMKTSAMAKILLSAATHLILIGALRATALDPEPASTCAGEGLQPNHTSGCREYFRCREGLKIGAYSCPEGLAFSAAARQCLPVARVPCVQHVCAPEDARLYAAPATQCRAYYRCKAGVAVELACPAGSWFDFEKQECSRTAGVCYEPVCTGQTDGRHPDTTQGCRRALHCSGGALRAVRSAAVPPSCASPRATAVAFPVAGGDRCAGLPDGPHRAPAPGCREYLVCAGGETESSIRCPDTFRFDGQKCAPEGSTPCVDECEMRDDGFHADLAVGCGEYFYCQNRSSLFRSACSEGTVFDGLMCISAAFYRCPVTVDGNPCLRRQDGYHRDFKDCRSFFFCSSEKLMFRNECPASQVWDGTSCVAPADFACAGPREWSGCAERAPGFYQDRTRGSDCKNYFHCAGDKRTDFVCPSEHIFNGEECVRSESYTCPSLETDSCDFKGDGFYQQTSGGCRAYYMCSKGYKSVYLCDISQVFNGDKCVNADSYKCPYQSDDCKGKSNGYHRDIKSNCRKYFFCEKGEKLTTIQCSGSKIFNGQGCVNPKTYQCPVGQDGNPCAFKANGFHIQSGSKCRKYFKCVNYKLDSYFSCPAGQVFDGIDSCAVRNCSGQLVTCEKDGFFADLSTRCKSYHICIDKKKSTFQCEGDNVFNGQLCVPEDSFPCPDECSQNHCNNTI